MAAKWEMATEEMVSGILTEELQKAVGDALLNAVQKFNGTYGSKGIIAGYRVTVQVTDGLTKYESSYGSLNAKEYKKLVRKISDIRFKELAVQE